MLTIFLYASWLHIPALGGDDGLEVGEIAVATGSLSARFYFAAALLGAEGEAIRLRCVWCSKGLYRAHGAFSGLPRRFAPRDDVAVGTGTPVRGAGKWGATSSGSRRA